MRERTRRVAACIPTALVEWTYTMLSMLNVATPPIYGMTSAPVHAASLKSEV